MHHKTVSFLLIILLFFSACIKQKYSSPESILENDPGYPRYITIAELRSNMGISGYKEITDNVVISGIVIADDKTNNFYKQIIIDDGTAAMPILMDAYSLYNDFPIGRKIYIKCKGLYTNYYYKLPQLGFAPDSKGTISPIPYLLWNNYIIKANRGNTIEPIKVSLAEVTKTKSELLNRLISMDNLQIADTSHSLFYALPADLSSATNITLIDCDSNSISLRTSGLCSFRAVRPSTGKGNIIAIYATFNNSPQLILRDTFDIQFTKQRCF
ncbi:MAG: DUF5689 domain-containing protein [Phycisphaerales bacterium]|nr:DUF5689 domain-containing protein [Phycisphaerales bacterium]